MSDDALALAKYTHHLPSCGRFHSTAESCSCGLQETWAAVSGSEKERTVNSRQLPDGRWVPAEPMPEAFGVVWERHWRLRRGGGEWLPLAVLRGFFDARRSGYPVDDDQEEQV